MPKIRNPDYPYTLRASSRRVLRLIESEITRQGGHVATIYADQLEITGSRRVWRPALAEIGALGLAEVERRPKKYICRSSDRWRKLTAQQARLASALARERCNNAAQPSHVAATAAADDHYRGDKPPCQTL